MLFVAPAPQKGDRSSYPLLAIAPRRLCRFSGWQQLIDQGQIIVKISFYAAPLFYVYQQAVDKIVFSLSLIGYCPDSFVCILTGFIQYVREEESWSSYMAASSSKQKAG